jgi:hypothetical protein
MKDFNEAAYVAFEEAASERYDFGSCKSGEKMTFGKCQKVGGSKKKKPPESLTRSKATAQAQYDTAKKSGNKNKMDQAKRRIDSINSKLVAYGYAEDDAQEFKSGCPDGFRSKGSQTISGKRREVCCTPDGKVCMTADGIPL